MHFVRFINKMGGSVIQRVRGCNASSPFRQKPSRQVGSKPACVLVRGGMKPGAASIQAVLLNSEICIVVVIRITSGVLGENADDVEQAEGSSSDRDKANRLDTTGVYKIRACIQRDNSGTWESLMFPCK